MEGGFPVFASRLKPNFVHPGSHVLSVILLDDRSLSRDYLTRSLAHSLKSTVALESFATIDEALSAICADIRLIVLYAHDETERKVREVLEAVGDKTIRLLVITDENTSDLRLFLKDALSMGVCGLVFTKHTDLKMMNAAVAFASDGGTIVPPELFTQLPWGEPSPQMSQRSPGKLSANQSKVFALLRQGKPNKVIAYELSISESQVKIHVRNIMRATGAINRTQAAFMAQKLGDA